jgi:ketosteroid isomerase-like protein
MSKSTEMVLREIYDAWRAQDLDWLASYLPDNFCHVVHIPTVVHPLGGISKGKQASLERLRIITVDFDFLKFDTSELTIGKNRAAVEIPVHYRHRQTGVPLESIFVNFWTLEKDCPVKLTEYHDVARIRAFVKDVAAAIPA